MWSLCWNTFNDKTTVVILLQKIWMNLLCVCLCVCLSVWKPKLFTLIVGDDEVTGWCPVSMAQTQGAKKKQGEHKQPLTACWAWWPSLTKTPNLIISIFFWALVRLKGPIILRLFIFHPVIQQSFVKWMNSKPKTAHLALCLELSVKIVSCTFPPRLWMGQSQGDPEWGYTGTEVSMGQQFVLWHHKGLISQTAKRNTNAPDFCKDHWQGTETRCCQKKKNTAHCVIVISLFPQ